jgi:hypothetical protein
MLPEPGKRENNDLDGELIGEVLFEIAAYGNAVKVSAIDPATNTEVSIVGSPAMSPYTLKMNAMRKLKHVLAKDRRRAKKAPARRHGLWA